MLNPLPYTSELIEGFSCIGLSRRPSLPFLIMFDFLALPTEIRYEIYRHLRRYLSLHLSIAGYPFGYVSYGFYPGILMTNHQISYEAKQVFYGENDCTYPYERLPLSDRCSIYKESPTALLTALTYVTFGSCS